jgi:hypothetical protein
MARFLKQFSQVRVSQREADPGRDRRIAFWTLVPDQLSRRMRSLGSL